MTSDAISDAPRYFAEFLPALTGQLLIPDLRDLTTSLEIHLRDRPESPWQIQIQDGRIEHVGQDGPSAPCRFTLDSTTFLEIAAGRLSSQEAFFAGNVDIEGDLELGLKLSTVLAPFFARFPYHP